MRDVPESHLIAAWLVRSVLCDYFRILFYFNQLHDFFIVLPMLIMAQPPIGARARPYGAQRMAAVKQLLSATQAEARRNTIALYRSWYREVRA